MTKESARRLSELMLHLSGQLNESVRMIQQKESDEEFKRYRKAVAHIMGSIWDQVLGPLYAEHPELEPPELKR
jgi:hypothetical protein